MNSHGLWRGQHPRKRIPYALLRPLWGEDGQEDNIRVRKFTSSPSGTVMRIRLTLCNE